MNLVLSLLALVLLTCSGAPAFAYVGPGAGLSLVGAFWGLLVAIFAAFAFVVLWPLRRMFKRRGAPAGAAPSPTAEPAEGSLLRSDQRNA